MKKVASGEWRVASVLLLLLASGATTFACGTERWPVKTLADPQARGALGGAMAATVVTTVTELTEKTAPDRKTLEAAASSRFPEELQRYQVRALVRGYKLEADGDFHIVLADPANPRRTMVAEIPDPACVPADYKDFFTQLRLKFSRTYGKPSTKFYRRDSKEVSVFTGVGFFDYIHGQTGVAPNGFELHPVLDFNVPVQQQPASWTADWYDVKNVKGERPRQGALEPVGAG